MSGAPPGSRVRITRRWLAPRFGVLLNYRESEPGRYTVRLDTAPGASAAPAAAVELDSAMFDRAGIRCDVLHPPLGKVVEVRFDGEQVWVPGRVVSLLLPEPTVKIALDDEVCTEVNSGFLKDIEAEWRFVVDQDGSVDVARANEDVARAPPVKSDKVLGPAMTMGATKEEEEGSSAIAARPVPSVPASFSPSKVPTGAVMGAELDSCRPGAGPDDSSSDDAPCPEYGVGGDASSVGSDETMKCLHSSDLPRSRRRSCENVVDSEAMRKRQRRACEGVERKLGNNVKVEAYETQHERAAFGEPVLAAIGRTAPRGNGVYGERGRKGAGKNIAAAVAGLSGLAEGEFEDDEGRTGGPESNDDQCSVIDVDALPDDEGRPTALGQSLAGQIRTSSPREDGPCERGGHPDHVEGHPLTSDSRGDRNSREDAQGILQTGPDDNKPSGGSNTRRDEYEGLPAPEGAKAEEDTSKKAVAVTAAAMAAKKAKETAAKAAAVALSESKARNLLFLRKEEKERAAAKAMAGWRKQEADAAKAAAAQRAEKAKDLKAAIELFDRLFPGALAEEAAKAFCWQPPLFQHFLEENAEKRAAAAAAAEAEEANERAKKAAAAAAAKLSLKAKSEVEAAEKAAAAQRQAAKTKEAREAAAKAAAAAVANATAEREAAAKTAAAAAAAAAAAKAKRDAAAKAAAAALLSESDPDEVDLSDSDTASDADVDKCDDASGPTTSSRRRSFRRRRSRFTLLPESDGSSDENSSQDSNSDPETRASSKKRKARLANPARASQRKNPVASMVAEIDEQDRVAPRPPVEDRAYDAEDDAGLEGRSPMEARIIKILRVGTRHDTGEQEAHKAMTLARRLMTKHNLEALEGSLLKSAAGSASGARLRTGLVTVKLRMRRTGSRIRRAEWLFELANAVKDNFEVQYFIEFGGSRSDLTFFGLRINAQLAASSYCTFFDRIQVLSRKHKVTPEEYEEYSKSVAIPLIKRAYTNAARVSYSMGCSRRLRENVDKTLRERETERNLALQKAKLRAKRRADALRRGSERLDNNDDSDHSHVGDADSSESESDQDESVAVGPSLEARTARMERSAQSLLAAETRLKRASDAVAKLQREEEKNKQLALLTRNAPDVALKEAGVKLYRSRKIVYATSHVESSYQEGKKDAAHFDLNRQAIENGDGS